MDGAVERPAGPAPAVVAGAAGVIVGLAWAGRPSYWFDEAATLSAVERSPGRLWTMLHHVDAVHGLYYGVMSGWVRVVGTDETATRAFSAVGLGVTCAVLALLGAELGGRRLAWAAGLAAVVVPGLAWSGSEARQYAWSAALATAATLLLVRSTRTGRARDWVGYGALVALGAYLFLFSLLLLPAHLVTLVLTHRTTRGWWAASGAALAVSVPLLVVAPRQFEEQLGWLSLRPWSLLRQAPQYFVSPRGSGGVAATVGAGCFLVTTVLLAVAALSSMRRTDGVKEALAVALPWALLPVTVLVLVSILGHPAYQQRYLTFCGPAVALVIGAGLTSLPGPARNAWAVGLVLLVAALPVLVEQKDVDAKSGENYRALAEFLGPQGHSVSGVVLTAAGEKGILVGYPERVRGVELLNGGVHPQDASGLWGTLHRPRAMATTPAPGTDVGLVSLTHRPGQALRWRRWLRDHDCRPGARLRESRFTVRVFHCR